MATDPFLAQLSAAAAKDKKRREEELQERLRREAQESAAAKGAYAPTVVQDNLAPTSGLGTPQQQLARATGTAPSPSAGGNVAAATSAISGLSAAGPAPAPTPLLDVFPGATLKPGADPYTGAMPAPAPSPQPALPTATDDWSWRTPQPAAPAPSAAQQLQQRVDQMKGDLATNPNADPNWQANLEKVTGGPVVSTDGKFFDTQTGQEITRQVAETKTGTGTFKDPITGRSIRSNEEKAVSRTLTIDGTRTTEYHNGHRDIQVPVATDADKKGNTIYTYADGSSETVVRRSPQEQLQAATRQGQGQPAGTPPGTATAPATAPPAGTVGAPPAAPLASGTGTPAQGTPTTPQEPQTPTAPPAAAAPATPAPAATPPAPAAPATTPYNPPARQALDMDRINATARDLISAQYEPQKQALQQAAERQKLMRQQETEGIKASADEEEMRVKRNLATIQEQNRALWGSRNLGVEAGSGFLAGANAVAQAASQQEIGKLARESQRALQQLAQRGELTEQEYAQNLQTMANAEGLATRALVEQMRREDRQYDLQEAQLYLQEWMAQNGFALDLAKFGESTRQFGLDYAIREADADLRTTRGWGLLPHELEQAALGTAGQQLANRSAELGVQKTEALQPLDIARANLDLIRDRETVQSDIDKAKAGADMAQTQAKAANEALWRDIEWFRQHPFEDEKLKSLVATAEADLKKLDREIARNPEYGKTAEAKQRMEKIKAEIDASKALAEERRTGKKDTGFTAWQDYQMLRDERADTQATEKELKAARDKAVSAYRSDYKIGMPAAETWVDYLDMLSTPKADGTMPAAEEAWADLMAVVGTGQTGGKIGLTEDDRSWLALMFDSTRGSKAAQEALNSARFRKGVKAEEVDGKDPWDVK